MDLVETKCPIEMTTSIPLSDQNGNPPKTLEDGNGDPKGQILDEPSLANFVNVPTDGPKIFNEAPKDQVGNFFPKCALKMN